MIAIGARTSLALACREGQRDAVTAVARPARDNRIPSYGLEGLLPATLRPTALGGLGVRSGSLLRMRAIRPRDGRPTPSAFSAFAIARLEIASAQPARLLPLCAQSTRSPPGISAATKQTPLSWSFARKLTWRLTWSSFATTRMAPMSLQRRRTTLTRITIINGGPDPRSRPLRSRARRLLRRRGRRRPGGPPDRHWATGLKRNILRFTGYRPVRHSIVGSVSVDAAHRENGFGACAIAGPQQRALVQRILQPGPSNRSLADHGRGWRCRLPLVRVGPVGSPRNPGVEKHERELEE